jgi:hypothetical protein
MTALTQKELVSRLQEIIDPCSAATHVPLSIVEMGMVENFYHQFRNRFDRTIQYCRNVLARPFKAICEFHNETLLAWELF